MLGLCGSPSGQGRFFMSEVPLFRLDAPFVRTEMLAKLNPAGKGIDGGLQEILDFQYTHRPLEGLTVTGYQIWPKYRSINVFVSENSRVSERLPRSSETAPPQGLPYDHRLKPTVGS